MIRLAMALAARHSTIVFLLTTTLGATRLQAILGKEAARLNVVQIDDGFDLHSESRFAMRLQKSGEEPVLEANMAVAPSAEVEVRRLIRLGVTDFVLDWLSFGFVDSIRAYGGRYCVSMPGSTFQADFCAAFEASRSGAYGKTQSAIQRTMQDTKILVHGFPRMFHSSPESPGSQIVCVGLFASPQEALPEEVEAFMNRPGPPVLYVFLGSLSCFTAEDLEVLYRALAAPCEWRVMWSLPRHLHSLLPASITLSEDFFLSPWLPPASILAHPACAATLIHGGWGSLSDAILSGKPVCCLPMFGDQPINAQIAQSMKIGLTIPGGDRSLANVEPRRIQDCIRAVLRDAGFLEAAKTWQREASTFGGADYAAEVVARYFQTEEKTPPESRKELEAAVVAFAEDARLLSFEDNDTDEVLPRGAHLEATVAAR